MVKRQALAAAVIGELQSWITREMTSGDQLPREQDLAARFGVSRTTLREALTHLEGTGVLVRRWGVGTFVADHHYPVGITMDRNTPIRDMLRAAGYEAAMSHFATTTVPPDTGPASNLMVEDGTPIWRVDRLFDAGDAPAIYLQDYVPATINGRPFDPHALGDANVDILTLLADAVGCHIRWMDVELEAITVDADTAKRMGMPAGAPAIHAMQIGYSRAGEAVIAGDVIYRTDVAKIHFRRIGRQSR